MGMTTALAGLATIVGIGAVASQGPALATVTNVAASTAVKQAPSATSSIAPPPTTPASATAAVGTLASATSVAPVSNAPTATPSASATAAASAGTAPSIGPSTAPAPSRPLCDDGHWVGPGGINVEGEPDGFDAGNRGAVYIWHSSDGWHIRSTDVTDTAHHYTGTVALSPGARFTSFSTVRLEHTDRVWLDGDNVLHYDFTTYDGIDGVNFTVSACDGAREHEAIRFDLDYNGHEDDPSRIALGDTKQHPASANFMVTRTL